MPVQAEPEATRLVNDVNEMTGFYQPLYPRHERGGLEPLRRLGQCVIVLSDDHQNPGMDVNP